MERSARPGWAIAETDGLVVAVETELDEELEREARVLELIHSVNRLRKEMGLEVTDRIVLTIPEADRDLLVYEPWIRTETLAVQVDARGGELRVEKA